MRTSAWKVNELESRAYWDDKAYEAEVEFNQASTVEEMQDAFDRWLLYSRRAGREV